jgi:signal transduction histidine kinase
MNFGLWSDDPIKLFRLSYTCINYGENMRIWIMNFLQRWSLVQRFTVISFLIIVSGTVGIGWWVGEQIKNGVIKESAVTAALYMDSFIAPNLQDLSILPELSPQSITTLNGLLRETDLGQRIVAFKVWGEQGHVLYSKGPSLFSDVFPNSTDQSRVWQGEVVAQIDKSSAERRLEQQKFNSRLLQIYSPVRKSGTNQVIAVAEFYQKVNSLEIDIAAAQRRSWLVVGSVMTVIYLLLVGFVRWAGNTINRQENELTLQVEKLTELLAQNNELHQRVQRAAAKATALNERILRRISADLHDGPTQELGVVLLRLDRVVGQNETCRLVNPNSQCNAQLPVIQSSLQHALEEMRSIAAGFGLPQLDRFTLPELLRRVVRSHEQRTGTKVKLEFGDLPDQANLPVKITVYRLVQEALTNSYRHAGGKSQQVQAMIDGDEILVNVSDQGSGFDSTQQIDWDGHLGLSGMRERVESLGGRFIIESGFNQGTRVTARLPLQSLGEPANG